MMPIVESIDCECRGCRREAGGSISGHHVLARLDLYEASVHDVVLSSDRGGGCVRQC